MNQNLINSVEENHENKQRGILTYALVSQLLITLQS